MTDTIRHHDLISKIDTFLAASGMGESYFGKVAVGNSELVKRLRNNGRVWPETERAILSFIRQHEAGPDK